MVVVASSTNNRDSDIFCLNHVSLINFENYIFPAIKILVASLMS